MSLSDKHNYRFSPSLDELKQEVADYDGDEYSFADWQRQRLATAICSRLEAVLIELHRLNKQTREHSS